MKVVNSHNCIVLELETQPSATTTTTITYDKENIMADPATIALVKHAALEGTPVYIRKTDASTAQMWPVVLVTNSTIRALCVIASNGKVGEVVVS